MKKLIKSKKGIAAFLVTLAVVAFSAAGAFAYFTNLGAGTGSVTVASASAIALSSEAPDPSDALHPGGPGVNIPVLVENNSDGAQHVGTVSGSVADNGACLGSWFQVKSVALDQTIDGNDQATAVSNVKLLDAGVNQDVCQGKTLTINWSSN
jgi:hypothetical protein